MADNSIIAFGAVAAAAAVSALLRRTNLVGEGHLLRWVLPLLTAAGVGFGITCYQRTIGALDEAMAQLENAPTVGILIREEPDARDHMRDLMWRTVHAATPEERDTIQAEARSFLQGLRAKYLGPALLKAPSEAIEGVWGDMEAVDKYLSQKDIKHCREFASVGIQNVYEMDKTAQALFLKGLSSLEAAYRSGKNSKEEVKAITEEEIASNFALMGFSADELQLLQEVALPKHSDDEVCQIGLKLYTGVSALPRVKGVPMMRFILAGG